MNNMKVFVIDKLLLLKGFILENPNHFHFLEMLRGGPPPLSACHEAPPGARQYVQVWEMCLDVLGTFI